MHTRFKMWQWGAPRSGGGSVGELHSRAATPWYGGFGHNPAGGSVLVAGDFCARQRYGLATAGEEWFLP